MTHFKRKKEKKRKRVYAEAKGLLLLALAVLFTLSLISFTEKAPSQNYLGIIGYSLAWLLLSLFGIGSYLIAIFTGWLGWTFLNSFEEVPLRFNLFYFSLFLISSCFLFNVFAETYPTQASLFSNKIFTETIFVSSPYPQFSIRYNLGGLPCYYLYFDLPLLNLHRLLSNVGITLIFSTSAIISFLLLLNLKIVPQTKSFFFLLKTFGISLLKKPGLIFKGFASLSHKILEIINFKKKKEFLIPQVKISSALFSKPACPSPKEKKQFSSPATNPTVIISKSLSLKNVKTNLELKKKDSSYVIPSFKLLTDPPFVDTPFLKKELEKQAEILEETLKNFGIKAKVGEINCGPTITSFEVHPSVGVKVQKIKTLENDIALNLQAKSIRIIAPIPGKAAVGVEIPSIHPQAVSLKEMLVYYQQTKRKHSIPLLLGKTVTGDHVIADLAKTPHLLIAGATGSGKSVCINTIVMSILMNLHPDDIKLIMIDPKKVELTQYSNLPHMIAPVITEAHGAYAALQWLVREMQKRYEILKQLGLRNITAFNLRKPKQDFEDSLSIEIPEKMPLIVAIIDEFADLMMVSSTDLETPIARIAQMARAVGIHLILATQRPSREVITGIIKANFPSRIAFKVASRINSQIILDETGAEALLGNGDLLFLPPGSSHLVRAQGAYISDEDINTVIQRLTERAPPSYLIPSFDAMQRLAPELGGEEEEGHRDKLYDQALTLVLQTKNASTTFLQRKLKIGYARAASLIDDLEENNVIGPQDGSKPRRIIADMSFLEGSDN